MASNVLSQKKAKALAKKNGWTETQGGKHVVKMEKAGFRPVTLPKHGGADYGKDLSASIRRQLLNPTPLG